MTGAYAAFLSVAEDALGDVTGGYRADVAAAVDQAAATIRDTLTEDGQPLTRERLGWHLMEAFAAPLRPLGPAAVALSRRDYALTVAAVLQLAGAVNDGDAAELDGFDLPDLEPGPEPPLRSGQVAAWLDVSRSTVNRLADEGLLACDRTPSGHRRFPASAVLELLTARQHDHDHDERRGA